MLQQSSASRPLPGEFVFLTQVAMLTGNHKVLNRVSGNTRSCNTTDREGVIDVMLSPLYPVAAVVAFLMLALVLLKDLRGGMGTWDRLVGSAPIVRIRRNLSS